jgi:hypothetical protein
LLDIGKQLGFECFVCEDVAAKIDELQEKAAIADQLQSDLINTDRDELQSERDYYRGILDKLCDRLNVADIEALEHVAKYQEMSLDFTSQHNDDLAQQLAESYLTDAQAEGFIREVPNWVSGMRRKYEWTGQGA